MSKLGDGPDTGINAEQIAEQERALKAIILKGLPPTNPELFAEHPNTEGGGDGWGELPDEEDDVDMNISLEGLKESASELSASERAELAHFLLKTLDAPEDGVSQAWRTELQRRMADLRSGSVVGKPIEDVLARLRERYP